MNTHELKKESNDVYVYRKRIHTQKDEKQTKKVVVYFMSVRNICWIDIHITNV